MGENIGNINQRHFVMLCEVVGWVLPLGRRMGWTIILLHCCLPGVRWVLLLIVKRTLSGKRGRHHQPSMDLYSEGWLSKELKLDRHMSRALRVLDTRLVLDFFCPTRTRLGPNTTRTE